MKPTTKLTSLATALSMATVLVACGGGSTTSSTDIAGIGGSGFVATGTITGFGSVFVNGIKFDTSSSAFNIDGQPYSRVEVNNDQDILSKGMVVKVNGVIDSNGTTGVATEIIFDDDLQGPVSNYTLSADALSATFNVLGIPVKIDGDTYFDGNITLQTIQNNDMVELSGFFDSTGTLLASRIEKKTDPNEKVELKGTITRIAGIFPNYEIELREFVGFNIQTSSFTELKDLPNNHPELGQYVEVKGTFNSSSKSIEATEIELEEFEFEDRNEFEMEGVITDFINTSSFKVNGIPVDASNAQHSPMNLTLTNDLHVEVEGKLDDGRLLADKIKMRGGEVEIQAPVTRINLNDKTIDVTPVEGEDPITIKIGSETDAGDDQNYLTFLENLNNDDAIEVKGFQSDDGNIFASDIEVSDSSEIEVQAMVYENNITLTTITMLGIAFEIPPNPEFESDTFTQFSDFWADLNEKAERGVLVKIKLPNNTTNVITEIEIEED